MSDAPGGFGLCCLRELLIAAIQGVSTNGLTIATNTVGAMALAVANKN